MIEQYPSLRIRVFHRVREEVIPITEGAGMDPKAAQALCAWAENLLMHR